MAEAQICGHRDAAQQSKDVCVIDACELHALQAFVELDAWLLCDAVLLSAAEFGASSLLLSDGAQNELPDGVILNSLLGVQ